VPETPQCPFCEAPIQETEATEVPSSRRGGFRVIVVACPRCHKVMGVGGLSPSTDQRPYSSASGTLAERPTAG
jgi:hypothetical protein